MNSDPGSRTTRPLLLILVAAAALMLAGMLWVTWHPASLTAGLEQAREECRARYRGARSAADSARVDDLAPRNGTLVDPRAVSGPKRCRDFRSPILPGMADAPAAGRVGADAAR